MVITVSDRGFAGEIEDASGPAVAGVLEREGFDVAAYEMLPDNRERIIDALLGGAGQGYDLVVTTGGTGLGPRDITPQATKSVIDYEVPGLAEQMRRAGAGKTPRALLSRSLAGVRGRTLILNLPGSSKGAVESLEAIAGVLGHAVQLLQGDTEHP
jgi:molybdenum cofactor synthesis domain-containing protein